ncbi:MAG TPA: divalent metal cation transporter [Candidatus Sulfotelmatobacter sp.]|jgi:Mn2+/Fe2+ NRAMP family transporter|nr:divalent metal cation transporter [Candidatus Sulfotelmatobacter sp.]
MESQSSSLILPAGPAALLRGLTAWGPGLLVMLADCDAGNVVSAAQAGAQWGYRLLPLLLLLIPVLYMVQELTVRLGIFTQAGHGALIRKHMGPVWAWLSLGNLAIAVLGTLVTEFSAVAGIGAMFGVGRPLSLSLAAATMLAVALLGSYRRIERAALIIGLFELAFFAVAWRARPDGSQILREIADIRLSDEGFLYLASALVGAVFNPWMIFYQQGAVAAKTLRPSDYRAERLDTAFGAVLTQCLTIAVLMAAASVLRNQTPSTIGEIGKALAPVLGNDLSAPVFAAGVLGAAMVAAIVSFLSLSWGVKDVTGKPWRGRDYLAFHATCVCCAALVAGYADDLVRLSVAAQALNVFLLPLVLGCLLFLSRQALHKRLRPSGWQWHATVATSLLLVLAGVCGGLAGLVGL